MTEVSIYCSLDGKTKCRFSLASQRQTPQPPSQSDAHEPQTPKSPTRATTISDSFSKSCHNLTVSTLHHVFFFFRLIILDAGFFTPLFESPTANPTTSRASPRSASPYPSRAQQPGTRFVGTDIILLDGGKSWSFRPFGKGVPPSQKNDVRELRLSSRSARVDVGIEIAIGTHP